MSNFIAEFADESKGLVFKPGLNEDVSLKTFSYEKTDDYEYVQLEFEKEGDMINDRVYAPSRVFPRMMKKRQDGNLVDDRMETEAEAWARTWGEVNAKLKHIATNFVTDEEFGNKLESMKPKSFKEMVDLCSSCIPPNFNEKKGGLLLGYNKKGFLSVPVAMWVTGHFFAVEGSGKELTIDRKLQLERPNDDTDGGSDEQKEETTSWTT